MYAPDATAPAGDPALRYSPAVDVRTLTALPGADLVIKGLADLTPAQDSLEALLVLIGAPKLRSLGLAVVGPSSLRRAVEAVTSSGR